MPPKSKKPMRRIAMAEVQRHATRDSLWMVINGIVVDVTQFASSGAHPGGEAVLLPCGGTDASQAFADIYHSERAKEMLTKYQVGILAGPGEAVDNDDDGSVPTAGEKEECSNCIAM